ncbi:MAG: CHAT domain-containing protein [Bacteroidia bacterium]|nr:CHAT domain-containing protein [Bacteroidia bacterium]MDW8235386.1 CHAT domain-containing tetratricopeptide repeat protein [Bacteroidia bacterium]
MKQWKYGLFLSALSAQPLLQTVDSLLKQGKYGSALGLYDSLFRTQPMPDTLQLRLHLKAAEAWGGANKPKEALIWIAPVESLALRLRDTLGYAELLGWRGLYHYQTRAYADAEVALQQAIQIVETQSAQQTLLYATLWRRRGLIAHDQTKYDQAEEYYRQSVRVLESLALTEHSAYASVLYNLAILYRETGRYAQAESLYLHLKAIQRRVLGTGHPEYARTLNNLANVYSDQSRYAEAEALYLEVKRIWANALGPEHPRYAWALNNLAVLYQTQGRYTEAEALHSEVKAIRAKVLGTDHPDYASTLNNLGIVYRAQGRYGEAEALYLEAKAIWARVLGPEHPNYALTLNNLANVYWAQGRYAAAETLHTEVKALRAKVLGTEHPDYAHTLNNLANIYVARGRYAAAETLHKEVRAIWAKALGTAHPDYAWSLNNLASVYEAQGRYAEAETLYLEAKAVWAKVLGPEHPNYSLYALPNLARLYQLQQRYREADTLWQTIVQKSFDRIRREFPTLPTAARQNLLENLLESRLSDFQRYVAERRDRLEIIQLGYRAARSFKGLLLSSTEAMKHLIETSRDTLLHARYRQWRHIANLYALLTLQENYPVADSLWGVLQKIEREIVLRLPALRDFLPDPAGEPLLPSLRPDEALIEVVRVPSGKKDSLLYLFYLLLPTGRKHTLYLHVHQVDTLWERRVRNSYRILHSPRSVPSGLPYERLWAFLDSLLPLKVRKVYFSPDGVYHLVNVATLYDSERKQFVADRYEVRYLASSRRLLLRRRRFLTQKPVVIGNPDFSTIPDTISEPRMRSYRLFEGGIPPLPGAEVEAKGIAQLLGVSPVIGKAATENYLKLLRSPKVLHVATHGYFIGGERNPLLAGGLLLAQAALWDSLFPPLGGEDGRLTAQEACNLNLIGTELVVLSACETGLGEVRGEGLYGLQRAFLEAGAQRVIATLWQIDDEATRELMLSFYQNSVKRKRREEIETVFYHTLSAFRKRYSHPYYWGAFVMMQ